MLFKLLVLSVSFFSFAYGANTIYITPGAWLRLFDIHDPFLNSDDQRQPTYLLKQTLEALGYTVKQADSLKDLVDVYCIIAFDIPFSQFNDLLKYPIEKRFLFLWEPPSVISENYNLHYHDYFSKIYTWKDDLVDNKKYFKFYYPVMHQMIEEIVPYSQKKLCTLIACNKSSTHPDELYSARKDVIMYFEENHSEDFDFYGRWWGSYKNYRGSITRKVDVLKNYKFCICYENIKNVSGYVTEKIFDCFWAGCIPVYWGASNITDYIPQNCFINREHFTDNDSLYYYLKNMSKEKYENYIFNIKQFLQTYAAKQYSKEYFVALVLDCVLSL